MENVEKEMPAALDIDKMLVLNLFELYNQIRTNGVNSKKMIEMQDLVREILKIDPVYLKVNITLDNAKELTFGELQKYYEMARTNYIVVHRVNYLAYDAIINLQDSLGKKYQFTVKKLGERSVGVYNAYMSEVYQNTEYSAYCVLQDHLRLTKDSLNFRIEAVFTAMRDKMISLGWRDVELKARAELALLLLRMAKYTRRGFFSDFDKNTGCDFTRAFDYADLSKMEGYFVDMLKAIGIRTEENEKGDRDLVGFNPLSYVRVEWAWDDFLADVRNDDLMDETAKKAIELNPSVAEAYKKELEDAENSKFQQEVDKLGDKFKLTKK